MIVVGAGALGCTLAARLGAAGVAVTLLTRWQQARQVIAAEGVRLDLPDGTTLHAPVAAADPDETLRVAARLALVVVKSGATAQAGRDLARRFAAFPTGDALDEPLAVTLQNGLGNRETLAAALGARRVGFGVTTLGATLIGPGWAALRGDGPIILEADARSSALAALLRRAGFAVEQTWEVAGLLWGKLAVSAAILPLTALLEVPNGQAAAHPAARRLLHHAAEEAAAVAGALGVALPYAEPGVQAETVARQTAANLSSMLQDVRRGVPTEIEAICGQVVKLGEELDVPTPTLRVLYDLIQAKTQTTLLKGSQR